MWSCHLQWQVNFMGALTFFFLKVIVACILCVFYVMEDNDSNVLYRL